VHLGKTILPVWHRVGVEAILEHSPALAGKLGVETSRGLEYVADEIIRAIKGSPPVLGPAPAPPSGRVFYLRPWYRFDAIAIGCWLALSRADDKACCVFQSRPRPRSVANGAQVQNWSRLDNCRECWFPPELC
jgi:hypothetical protein